MLGSNALGLALGLGRGTDEVHCTCTSLFYYSLGEEVVTVKSAWSPFRLPLSSFLSLSLKMATATLFSPEAPTSTTAAKILNFFHSLLLFLLNTLRRALHSLSRIGRSSSSPSPSHTTFASAQPDRYSLPTMTSTTAPPNRLQHAKVLPALPLVPSRRSSPGKDSKENTAPSRKEAVPLPQHQPQAQFRKTEPAEKLTEHLSHLHLNGINGDAADTTTSPSTSPAPHSLPGFVSSPSLPIPEVLAGDRAIYSSFMREALDMVRAETLSLISLRFLIPRHLLC